MLSSTCAVISEDLLLNCVNPLQSGTRDQMIIFNFDDWNQLLKTVDPTNNQIVTDITLISGLTGYLIQGINNSNMPKTNMKKGKFLNSFIHDVNFKVFTLGSAIKQQLENVARGRFVVIVENSYKGNNGECSYEIYGMNSGLIASVIDRDPSNADTQGAFDVTLTSSELSLEAHLPATLFNTDYPTTKSIFEGLAS